MARCMFNFSRSDNHSVFMYWGLTGIFQVLIWVLRVSSAPLHSLLSHLWTTLKFSQSSLLCSRTEWHLLFSVLVRSFITNVYLQAVHLSLRHTSAVPQAPTLPSSLIFHMQTLGAKSFIKCSGCYDNYECSTCRYNKSLKKLSRRCTVPQL